MNVKFDKAILETLDACPLCKNKNIKSLGKISLNAQQEYSGKKLSTDYTSHLYTCKECHSKFVSPRLSELYARQLYAESPATRWVPENKRELEDIDSLFFDYTPSGFKRFFLEEIAQDNNRGKKILDAGCFRGKLLDIFKHYNFDTFGLDLNEDAIKQIGDRHSVLSGDIESADKFALKFNIIMAFDVIEHLYDIEKFWKSIFNNLKEKGLCLILTGNPNALGAKVMRNKWWYFQYPEHIIFPSKKYYKSVAGKYGLKSCRFFKVHHRSAYKIPVTDHYLIVMKK